MNTHSTIIARFTIFGSCLALISVFDARINGQRPPGTPAGTEVSRVIDRYVAAIGGKEKIERVTTRVTRGTFDNGRGLREPFVTWISTGRIATIVGRRPISEDGGSGRGYDGRIGWDKNFIGTGLRTVTGRELAELARTADPFPAAHLVESCRSTSIDRPPNGPVPAYVIRCELDGRVEQWRFDDTPGLLRRMDAADPDGGRPLTIEFEEYRQADGILTPHLERIAVPGATIVYDASTIRYGETVEPGNFARPDR